VYTSTSQSPGHPGAPVPGEFSWHELATREQPAAFRFYQTLFAWDPTNAVDMPPIGTYQMFGANGVELGGMFNKPDGMPGPPAWMYYILVPNLQHAVDAVNANGGQVLNGPMEVPGGDWIAQCLDPQGAVFALHSKAKG
jgi:predicted enzyme related to lactoylglutathione lyase